MTEYEKREECISNLIQQIGWIEDIDSHKFPGWGHTVNAMQQAIALLKAQEPMRPGLGIIHHDDGSKSYFLHCPFDGTTLDEGDNYCRRCGRAVKWK